MKEKMTEVLIPTSLYNKITEKIKGSKTSSVSSYVTKILRESLVKEEAAQEAFSKEEEEKVKQKLRALGYLD